ncbi:MAG TPA: helix-turn-helix transcriptional regulator [Clostridiales bacterium]|jgi:transcriptional regulator with XRE-family HTH domain|nr:helix-turn-helix transcriptional regulator [Clostridiales bacterium]
MAAGLTQKELAQKMGIAERTIQYYELGQRKPRKIETVEKLAEILGVDMSNLLDARSLLLIGAEEKGGARSAREVEELVSELSALFAGGELADEEKDVIMAALNRAYWDAKEDNKKYARKKYNK